MSVASKYYVIIEKSKDSDNWNGPLWSDNGNYYLSLQYYNNIDNCFYFNYCIIIVNFLNAKQRTLPDKYWENKSTKMVQLKDNS